MKSAPARPQSTRAAPRPTPPLIRRSTWHEHRAQYHGASSVNAFPEINDFPPIQSRNCVRWNLASVTPRGILYHWPAIIQRWNEWPTANLAEFLWHYHIPYSSVDRSPSRSRHFNIKAKQAMISDITPGSARARMLLAVPTQPRVTDSTIRKVVTDLVATTQMMQAFVVDRLTRPGPPGEDGRATRIPASDLSERKASALGTMLKSLAATVTEVTHLTRIVGVTDDEEVEPVPVLETGSAALSNFESGPPLVAAPEQVADASPRDVARDIVAHTVNLRARRETGERYSTVARRKETK